MTLIDKERFIGVSALGDAFTKVREVTTTSSPEVTVFTARRVITMEPTNPTATAVAVRDGMIVEVGSLESLRPWLDHHPHVIDDRFAEQVLLPGLIDPHVHPSLMAALLAVDWITPEPWDLPRGSIPATTSRDGFVQGLEQLLRRDAAAGKGPEDPLIVFGYHAQFHDEIVRADLDRIEPDRPVILWQRSFHEIRCNSPALHFLDAFKGAEWDPHIDTETGRMYESGMAWGLNTLMPIVLEPTVLRSSLVDFASMVRAGGITTIVDAGLGNLDIDLELDAYRDVLGDEDIGFATHLMLSAGRVRSKWRDELFDIADAMVADSPSATTGDRLGFLKAAKFFADGAFIAQLMQVGGPGYVDGHQGAWMMEPAQLLHLIRPWWNNGWDIHIHVNGDLGVDACLDATRTLLQEHPRFDHRTTLHHFGVSNTAQCREMGLLGMHASANGYYLLLFADRFASQWLGTERASQMTRLGSVVAAGATASVHSDVPMGPLAPLLAASTMVTRRTIDGTVMAPGEALSIDQALRSITIDAAFQMRLDHRIGSLAAGKDADLVALAEDPTEVDPASWPSIVIAGTVSRGRVCER